MISVLSTNIISPLGFTTEQNYQAVLSGSTALRRYEGMWGLPEPFAASLFSDEQKAPTPYIIEKEIDEQTDAQGKLKIKISVKANQ